MQDVLPSAVHEPLSQSLTRILEGKTTEAGLTPNQLLERTDGRGIYFVFIILSLPFVAWVSLPGMSTVLGAIIALLALRLVRGKSPRLTSRLGDHNLSPKFKKIVLGGGLKFCRLLEKVSRPRKTKWLAWRLARTFHALLILVMALLLMLPLPSPPFLGSNTLPSYAIILLALAIMEEDGVMIWFAYLASIVSVAYFGFFGGLITTYIAKWFHALMHMLDSVV